VKRAIYVVEAPPAVVDQFSPMQMIEPTFSAHALPGYEDWKNPLHNTIAAIRYIADRYGSPYNLPKGGYAKGGIVPANLHVGEMVLPKELADFIRRAARNEATGVGRVFNDVRESLARAFDKASVSGMTQPTLTP
jgi:hypothetical protein